MSRLNAGTPADLPPPRRAGRMSLERAIAARRCVRDFTAKPLAAAQIAQLCWAGQGITEPREQLRAAPSAGALYPIELYLATANGVDRYQPKKHRLRRHLRRDVRPDLQRAALDQEMITQAPLCIVIAAAVKRTAHKYGRRAQRYCFMEVGHVAQNILLQATALRLAGVPIGAFEDRRVAALLMLPRHQRALCLLAIGHPRG
jgi:SagB-type dehydrogenase family enzyme